MLVDQGLVDLGFLRVLTGLEHLFRPESHFQCTHFS